MDAEQLPSGWVRCGCGKCSLCWHVNGSVAVWRVGAEWAWCLPNEDDEAGRAPSAAQAMCAALGITFVASQPQGCWYAQLDGKGITNWWRDIDQCARAALEAFRALQQPAPAPAEKAARVREMLQRWGAEDAAEPPADDECKCWHVAGKRIPNRWCALHASEWQTLAEQRSDLHEDGTPRAGCGYCASTPELDARERGLR